MGTTSYSAQRQHLEMSQALSSLSHSPPFLKKQLWNLEAILEMSQNKENKQ